MSWNPLVYGMRMPGSQGTLMGNWLAMFFKSGDSLANLTAVEACPGLGLRQAALRNLRKFLT